MADTPDAVDPVTDDSAVNVVPVLLLLLLLFALWYELMLLFLHRLDDVPRLELLTLFSGCC